MFPPFLPSLIPTLWTWKTTCRQFLYLTLDHPSSHVFQSSAPSLIPSLSWFLKLVPSMASLPLANKPGWVSIYQNLDFFLFLFFSWPNFSQSTAVLCPHQLSILFSTYSLETANCQIFKNKNKTKITLFQMVSLFYLNSMNSYSVWLVSEVEASCL